MGSVSVKKLIGPPPEEPMLRAIRERAFAIYAERRDIDVNRVTANLEKGILEIVARKAAGVSRPPIPAAVA